MRFVEVWLFIIIFSSSIALAQEVLTTAELENAVDNEVNNIELNAPVFLLTSDIIVNHDCNFVPHQNRSGDGGVIIDGNDLFNIYFMDANITVGQDDPNNMLTFTHGDNDSARVYSANKKTSVEFNYCNFINSFRGNGLATRSGEHELTVTCNNCQANYNYSDGFNLHNINDDFAPHSVILNNCSAVGNDVTAQGEFRGDGVTAHNPNQTIYIHGGIYRNNGKSGVGLVGGSNCFIDGNPIFYNNGSIVPCGYIFCFHSGYLEIHGATFLGLNYPETGLYYIKVADSTVILSDCVFSQMHPASQRCDYVISVNSNTVIRNCIFTDTVSSGAGIVLQENESSQSSYFIENCSFYNSSRHIDIRQAPEAVIKNCIFSDASEYAILSIENNYSDNPENGYNCFYSNEENFSSHTEDLSDSDIQTNPLFADVEIGDLHLKSQAGRWDVNSESWVLDTNTSPCIDAGDPNTDWFVEFWPHGKRTNIGTYGNTKQASMSQSNAGNIADLNIDGAVNLLDLSNIAKVWLIEGILLPADMNRDTMVDLKDISLLAENWLIDNTSQF